MNSKDDRLKPIQTMSVFPSKASASADHDALKQKIIDAIDEAMDYSHTYDSHGSADRILAIPEIAQALGKCCDGGPQWGHALDCPKCPN